MGLPHSGQSESCGSASMTYPHFSQSGTLSDTRLGPGSGMEEGSSGAAAAGLLSSGCRRVAAVVGVSRRGRSGIDKVGPAGMGSAMEPAG